MAFINIDSAVNQFAYVGSQTVGSVPAGNWSVQTFTLKGLKTEAPAPDTNIPSGLGNLLFMGSQVTAADTLALTFFNPTGAPIAPGSVTIYVVQ